MQSVWAIPSGIPETVGFDFWMRNPDMLKNAADVVGEDRVSALLPEGKDMEV